jgi:hypothetical protein
VEARISDYVHINQKEMDGSSSGMEQVKNASKILVGIF